MEELKQQISYITDDVDDNENEKVEIYWPFDILEVSKSILNLSVLFGINGSSMLYNFVLVWLYNFFLSERHW